VKGKGKSKLSAYTQKQCTKTAKSTCREKSRDLHKGGTEGHSNANWPQQFLSIESNLLGQSNKLYQNLNKKNSQNNGTKKYVSQ